MANNNDFLEAEGTIISVYPNTMFKVKLDENDCEVLAHLCGKMRKRYIRIMLGDRVKVEISKYDVGKCRITYRLSGRQPVFDAQRKKKYTGK